MPRTRQSRSAPSRVLRTRYRVSDLGRFARSVGGRVQRVRCCSAGRALPPYCHYPTGTDFTDGVPVSGITPVAAANAAGEESAFAAAGLWHRRGLHLLTSRRVFRLACAATAIRYTRPIPRGCSDGKPGRLIRRSCVSPATTVEHGDRERGLGDAGFIRAQERPHDRAHVSRHASVLGCETCHELHGSSDSARRIPARKVNGKSVASAGPELCFACHTDNATGSARLSLDLGSDPRCHGVPDRRNLARPGRLRVLDQRAPADAGDHAESVSRRADSARGGRLPLLPRRASGRNAYDGLLATFAPPTASTLASDQAKGTYAALCFGCHGGVSRRVLDATVDIKQFATRRMRRRDTGSRRRAGTLPVGAPLPCYECHNPHGSARDNGSLISDALGAGLETSSSAGVRRFCFSCHTTRTRPWMGQRGGDATPPCDLHGSWTSPGRRYRRRANALHLPTGIVGHTQGSSSSCYDCHGDTYAAGGNNVHDPSVGDYDAGTHTGPRLQTISIGGSSYTPPCTDCHDTELSTEHGKATSSSAANGCASCHPTPRDTLAPWDKSCAQGSCHTLVSSAPMHSNIETAHAALPVNSGCTSGTACHGGDLAGIHSEASTSVVSPGAAIADGGVRVRSLAALRSTAATTTTVTSCQVCHAAGIPATRNCIECHVGFSHFADPQMAAEAVAHTAAPASQTVVISGITFGPVACADCHASQLVISSAPEHQGSEQCVACHPAPKNTLTPVWDKSCAQGGCHTAGSTAPMHASIDASHAPVAGQTCYTAGCHPASATDSLAKTHELRLGGPRRIDAHELPGLPLERHACQPRV